MASYVVSQNWKPNEIPKQQISKSCYKLFPERCSHSYTDQKDAERKDPALANWNNMPENHCLHAYDGKIVTI